MCPLCRRLVNGDGSFFERGRLVCHCLVVEPDDGRIVLVDTGFGLGDCEDPERFPPRWRREAGPRLDPEETAVRQLASEGIAPEQVTDIVLTHLDRDHAGGVRDFPQARVHVHELEWRALNGEVPLRPGRYLAQQMPLAGQVNPIATGGETWFGLPAARPLGEETDVLMVALPGHTPGHSGVAVRGEDGRWLLHAGDAFYQQRQLAGRRPSFLLGRFEKAAANDKAAQGHSLAQLQALAREHGDEIEIFCSHDPAAMG